MELKVYGDERDIETAKMVKKLADALHAKYKDTKIGEDHVFDTSAGLCDEAINMWSLLERLYDKD